MNVKALAKTKVETLLPAGHYKRADLLVEIMAAAQQAGITISEDRAIRILRDTYKTLRKERGIHIRADLEHPGMDRVRSLDEAVRCVTTVNRLAVVRRARIAKDESVGIQHAPGISDEVRIRLNHEEARLTRGLMHVEAAYLNRQRKLEKQPPGLEEE